MAFLAALALCLVGTLIAKLAFHACEPQAPPLGIESPSGHVSFSAVFYGCLTLVIAAGRPLWQRATLYVGAALFVLLIGASRVYIWVHTVPDVVAGLAIGVLALTVFPLLRGPPRPLILSLSALSAAVPLAVVILVIALFFGRAWTPEPLIDAAALRLGVQLKLCGPPS